MSRLSLLILPALCAASAASVWEQTSQDLDGAQRPLHGDEGVSAHKLPSLKLNDGYEIPTVRSPIAHPARPNHALMLSATIDSLRLGHQEL